MRKAAVCSLLILLCSCAEKSNTEKAAANVMFAENGLAAADRERFYHEPEGSELLPLSLLKNLESTATHKPFLEQMDRFGFIQDASNPDGLPVGLTAAKSKSSRYVGIRMVGFNCSACHVGQITYRGKTLRIDGAPGLVNLQTYQEEFADSLDATLRNPVKRVRLISAMAHSEGQAEGEANPADTAAPPETSGYQAPEIKPTAEADAATAPKVSFAQYVKEAVSRLNERRQYLKNAKTIIAKVNPPGPGRVDAFGAARNLLFPASATELLSPVSYPWIWAFWGNAQNISQGPPGPRLHYDGNSNSVVQRNIGQALGMGAVFDPKTWSSTLRVDSLGFLEDQARKLQPPKWPAAMLGEVNTAKVERGRSLFEQKCVKCHDDRLVPMDKVDTDATRINDFGRKVKTADGKMVRFADGVKPILAKLQAKACEDAGMSPEACKNLDYGQNPDWWTTTTYKARRLEGVWATAPYLHNGSVPNLRTLLDPADKRPKTFCVGSHEFDPENVGYVSWPASGNKCEPFTFDTTISGNSNRGHTGTPYGTDLSPEEKSALLEYLKVL